MHFSTHQNVNNTSLVKKYSLVLLFFLFSSFLVVPTASAACPEVGSAEFGDVGELVQLIACTDEGLTGNNQAVTIDTPQATLPGAAAASAIGDLLVAVVQTDGAGETLNNVANYSGDWTPATGTPYISAVGVTSMIWTRIADGTEPANYTFDWNSNEQVYGYILRFTGASGLYQMAANNTGTSNTPIANSVPANGNAFNSLILRMVSADNRRIVQDVSPNPALHTLITMEASRPTGGGGGATVSGGASYRHQSLDVSASGNANFTTLTTSDEWHTRSMAIEPYEFRFSMPDATAGVCGTQQVTLSVTNSAGAIPPGSPMESFAGLVTISASASGSATWADGPGLTNSISDLGSGNATYQFNPADNGVAVFEFYNPGLGNVVDFNVSYGSFGESTNYTSPPLTIINCEFVVTNEVGDEVETCAMEAVTITLQDTAGNPANTYSGTLSIDNGSGDSFGNYLLNAGHTGAGSFSDAIADDGKAEYTFALTPSSGSNVLVLDYIHGSADLTSIDFVISEDSGDNYLVASITSLDVIACEIIVTLPDGDTTRDVCTMTRVRFTVSAGGSAVTSFAGTISLTTSATQGLWFENAAESPYPGTLTPGPGDGTGSYDFNGSENGVVTLDFRNQVTATNLGFIVSGVTDEGVTLAQSGAVPVLTDIAQCTITITTANATVNNISDVCRAAESVTYTLTDRDGGAATAFVGTVVMQASPAIGNYVLTAGAGDLTGPGGNDGFATYEFDSTDDGVFTVGYSVLAAPGGLGDVTLTASLTATTLVNTDGTLRFRDCVFNISFPGDTDPFKTDVCSIKEVRIDLVDADADPVSGYTGSINLSTSSGFGSWVDSDPGNDGTLTDPFGEDGAASYTFDAADGGIVLLDFTHSAAAAAAVNINVTDGVTSDPGSPGSATDPNLLVELCTFQISFDGGATHDDAAITACEVQAVTIEIFDSAGVAASSFAGQINLSTSTGNGNWGLNGMPGTLTDVGGAGDFVADDGAVFYTFNGTEPGLVTLNFSSLGAESVNFNVVDQVVALGLEGVIVEEGAADPNLDIGSCLPSVVNQVCNDGGDPLTLLNLPITAQASDPSLRGRMVVVVTSHEGNATVNQVNFETVVPNATLLKAIRLDEGGNDSYTTMWAFNDATLPTGAGTYDVVIDHGDNGLAACAYFINDVEQVFPAEDLGTPANGQLNATSSPDNDAVIASTTVTTTENNALIISAVGNGASGDYDSVSPSPPMLRLSQGPDPDNAAFATSSGNASTAAAITIDETASVGTVFRYTHIVAAFNPLISGPPVATGYEPVILFETYSGNLSYRAIGGSFQTGPNGGGVCNMPSPIASGSATLTLPDAADGLLAADGNPFSDPGEFDSDVQAAWLYWFGSGSYDLPNMDGTGAFINTLTPANFDNVTFSSPNGLGGFNVTNITADDVFVIENVGSNTNADYYVGYKDVTGLMVGTSNELTGSDQDPNGLYTLSNVTVDDNQPWLGRGSCAGGFALIVIYENTYEQLRVINLFHGFQPFQNSSFTLVPRNFRIAARDTVTNTPNGQVTHITVEGDAAITGVNEALTIQDAPGDFNPANFNPLFTDYNPAEAEFNGTATRPIFDLNDVVTGGVGEPAEYKYIFDDTPADPDGDGNPFNGYELDFENPAVFPTDPSTEAAGTQFATSYGVDVDTHFIDGDEIGDILYNFADPSDLAEEITTRYAADQDLVLLIAEIISVNNAPIADIEVTISEASLEYKVGTTGVYDIKVKNNGNGAVTFGEATGYINLVGELPPGMTFTGLAPIVGTGWDCTDFSASAFTCFYDIPAIPGLNEAGPSLPIVSATVTIAEPPAFFPSLNNSAKVITRVQHSDGTCLGASTGILPTPTNSCEPPEFDNVNDLAGGAIDINDLDDKSGGNNNVHSITTNVRGKVTDLSVVKSVVSVLEEGTTDTALYTITVTNNGPDDVVANASSFVMRITDNEPTGINFDSATGTDWVCTINTVPNPDVLSCEYDTVGPFATLASGASSVITVVGDVTGSSPTAVTNTVQVTSGIYNFDNVPGNNTSVNTTNITAEPAAVTDRFLLSVSASGNVSLGSGGGLLSNFNEDDIVLYDPQTDSAELFIDSATTPSYSVTDPNAIHLQPNGQVVLSSSADGNTIGTNNQAFDKDDIVLYDKLLNTATLLFDGSLITTGTDPNIDSVYVLDDGRIIFSTAATAGDGVITWSDSDLVIYDPVGGTFTIYLNAEDDNVFDAVDAQVDALYLRVDPADSEGVLDSFVLSSSVATIVGDDGVAVGLDDVAELTIDGGSRPNPTSTTSTNLFNGNIPIGVFDTTDPNLRLNALHLIEPAHLGHFSITQFVVGDACTPALLKITKHETLGVDTHVIDTDYTGSVIVSTDTVDGVWSIDTGAGGFDNGYGGGTDNGQARYTFVPGDNGEVILSLNVTETPPVVDSVGVSVTNGFVTDEDNTGPFDFSLVVTNVQYLDNFSLQAIDNNDGSSSWSQNWAEVDALNGNATGPGSGLGMTTGNVQITGGKLSLTSNLTTAGGSVDPSMTRPAGIGLFDYTEPVLINFHYGYQSVTSGSDVVLLQISNDDSSYVTVQTYNTLDGTSGSDVAESVDISSFITDDLGAEPGLVLIDDANPDLYVRFVITAGYVLGTFTVDDFEVTTSTNACNTGGLSHYHISIPVTGLACVTSNVIITGHDAGHGDVAIPNGTVLTLTTNTGAGSWVNFIGTGTLLDTGTIAQRTDGQATYTLSGGDETSIAFNFNYTDPVGDTPLVNINVSDGTLTEIEGDVGHDPNSTFSEAGLVFYDQDAGALSTTLPFQIAGKPSSTAPASGNVTIQLVRSVPIPPENAAAACESLVDDGDIVTITFAGLCIDPMGCDVDFMSIYDSVAVGQVNVPVFDSPTANPEQQGTAVDISLTFADLGAALGTPAEQNIGAPLNFIYPDAGTISLHAQYEIPLNNDIAGFASGDFINGASSTFVVRPFAFDIDFDTTADDRSSTGPAPFTGAISYATDENGPAFARAGVGFPATVSAVLWEAADDANNDGIADLGADLSNNIVATNFGDETAVDNTVIVSVRTDNPGVPGGVNGAMVTVDGSSDTFQAFSAGSSGPQNIAIDEVGIFNLSAVLVDNNTDRNAINYYETTPYSAVEGVVGGVINVGRIYPNHFFLQDTPPAGFVPRVNQSCNIAPALASSFTYMGEDFGLSFELQARNFQGDVTQNYRNAYAKLALFDDYNISAIIDVGGNVADTDVSGRLVNTDIPVPAWVAGILTVSGDMNIARLVTGEDAPLVNVQISLNPTDANDDGVYDGGLGVGADNDVLLNILDVDLDDGITEPGTDAFKLIATHEFRYGRLLVDNTYGSELEDLDIPIRIEYFDGTDFVVNTADSCTALVQTYPSPDLDFVAGSYESNDVGNLFEAGDTAIENSVDVTLNVFQGQTARLADGNNDDTDDTDRPFFTTAPDTEQSGRVLVEFDLDPGGSNAPTSLFFLKYDWRGGVGEDPGDEYDEVPEGANYTDNPRGIVEFGSFRGHDRIINWQEIYIGPGP